ncbi:MAG: glycosyltransferase family 4 protein [Chitinophagales bacterium]|nr:glycosyltransferase family 4 protein [Chitinophagales bacterium]
MKIAVNTRFLIKDRLEGIGWFTYESLKRITQQHPEHQFIFLFDRPYPKEFIFSPNITGKILFPQARHPLLWYLWFEWSVAAVLRRLQADIFLSTDGYLSLSASCKQVVVLHDLAFEHFPDHINALAARYYRHYTPKFAKRADRIATVSEFSKQDIVNLYGINPEKIDVVYNGSHELFHPMNNEAKAKIKGEFTSGCDYFIYVGALQPRKNIINLFLAFDEFKSKNPGSLKLVTVGRNWSYREALKVHASMQHKDDVIFLNHLSRNDLSKLIGASLAMVYVSLFEGFGIPIIEAMNCDIPVLSSNVSSMPEVTGDAGLLADPYSVTDIADKMEQLYCNEKLRNELVRKAKIQREKFTWQRTADELWKCLIKAST